MLPAGWLMNPGLLELRFGYELLDRDIPGRHVELFRDSSGGPNEDGFMLRVTLDPTPTDEPPIPEPLTATLGLMSLSALMLATRRRHA